MISNSLETDFGKARKSSDSLGLNPHPILSAWMPTYYFEIDDSFGLMFRIQNFFWIDLE